MSQDYNKFCSSLIQNGVLSEKMVQSMLEDQELKTLFNKYLHKDTRGFHLIEYNAESYSLNPYVLQSICDIMNIDYHNFNMYRSDKKVIAEVVRIATILNAIETEDIETKLDNYSVSIDIRLDLTADILYNKIHSSLVFCCINGSSCTKLSAIDADKEVIKRLLPRLKKDGLQVSYDSCNYYTVYCEESDYDLENDYTEEELFNLMRNARNSKVYFSVARYCREVYLPLLFDKILSDFRAKMETASKGDSIVLEYVKTRTSLYNAFFTILREKNFSFKLSKDYYVINI